MSGNTFKYEASVYKASQGKYTVYGYPSSGTYTITDTSDGPSDNQTELGDISNDHFSETTTSGSTKTRIYVGDTANGQSVISKVATKKGYAYFILSNTKYQSGTTVAVSSSPYALCFASGTGIATARGSVAVEDLKVGDLAITATGGSRPIVWIGCRELGVAGAALSEKQQPVRVRANAFGAGVPKRDVYLSQGHPILVGGGADGDDVLVPVMCLINGTSIARAPLASVTYWHVELDKHDILVADGLPVESYIDLGSRAFFDGVDHPLHDPDGFGAEARGRCLTVVTDGPAVQRARERLDVSFADEMVAHCGWGLAPAARSA